MPYPMRKWPKLKDFVEKELKPHLLELVTRRPGLDDVELAEILNEDPFEVSEGLHALARRGLIQESR